MILPPAPNVPPVVTERGVLSSSGHWYLCTQCVAVMGASNSDRSIPYTQDEARRLWTLSGHSKSPATTLPELMAEMEAAWGHTPAQASSLDNAFAAVKIGAILGVGGPYPDLPLADRVHDQAGYTGGHEIAFGPLSDDGTLIWMRDPLAVAGYPGQWAAWSSLVKFNSAWGPEYIRIFPKNAWEAEMVTLKTPTGIARVGTDPNIRALRTVPVVAGVVIPLGVDVPVYGVEDIPGFSETGAATSPTYLISDGTGALIHLLQRNTTGYWPAGGGITQADLDKAVADQKAADAAAQDVAVAAAKTALDQAVAAQKAADKTALDAAVASAKAAAKIELDAAKTAALAAGIAQEKADLRTRLGL